MQPSYIKRDEIKTIIVCNIQSFQSNKIKIHNTHFSHILIGTRVVCYLLVNRYLLENITCLPVIFL